MVEAITRTPRRLRYYIDRAGRAVVWSLVVALGLLIAAQLVFFAIHATHMLHYSYPLDYGEGPLLAQVPIGKLRPLLADGVVKHVGEAVALVVADSPAQARDAADGRGPRAGGRGDGASSGPCPAPCDVIHTGGR